MANAANGAYNNMENMANSAMGTGGAVSPHYNTQDISQLPQTYYGHPFGPPYLSAPAVAPPYPSFLDPIPWVAARTHAHADTRAHTIHPHTQILACIINSSKSEKCCHYCRL